MSDKKLDDLYGEHHQIEEEIKRREATEERKKKQLLDDSREANVQGRMALQHKDDMIFVGVWAVVSGVVGIGLGLLIAWIF